MSIDAVLDIVDSNKHLRKLEFWRNLISNQIDTGHIERLCSAVHNHALVELDLYESFAPGVGDRMLASLLTIDGLKLEKLSLVANYIYITSAVSTVLADFLASNPRLKELDLDKNHLNDIDAASIATALRSNTTLRTLRLDENNITHIGAESLRLVLDDDNSLNAAGSSRVWTTTGVGVDINWKEVQINRGWKIYSILSFQNQTLTNVNYFDNIDVKSLPHMIVAVQKYHDAARSYFNHNYDISTCTLEPLSIVYEIMRKWDEIVIHQS
ncbi:leucine-rich repeat protein [Skeletonema marinoi]|uniref:Leucine-rich repeat protein n=1 Tax=Skeletonema marinoi TaxID=267567 RepID=A0AAD9D9I0_9STRA|nr:leucine-rich repeat protein [Skeletonema marinoi]